MDGKAGRSTGEYSRMIQGKKTGEIRLSEIEHLLQKEDPFARSAAVQAIARIGGREAYRKIIDMIRNDPERDVVNQAIIAAAQTRLTPTAHDSRFLFPLANLYLNSDDYQTKLNVLNALNEIGDPRAIDFLKQIKETEKNEELSRIIERHINTADPEKIFTYTFARSEEQRQAAESAEGTRVLVTRMMDFYRLAASPEIKTDHEGNFGPLTYIISEQGRLIIGAADMVQEHVIVARGHNVIAAGEITLHHKNGKFTVTEINNTSNGYYPARTCFETAVKPALDSIPIEHPGRFTYLHPREGFFSDEFLAMFPFHPEYEKENYGKKRKKK